MNPGEMKLKASLSEAIQEWIDQAAETADWDCLDTYISSRVVTLMTDAAFAVLLAQSDLTAYLKQEEMLRL